MKLKPGQALVSVTDTTAVLVVKADDRDVALTCGGREMAPPGAGDVQRQPPVGANGNGTLLGKRYTDADGTVEVLCTKAGDGELALDGVPLVVKAATPLPASD